MLSREVLWNTFTSDASCLCWLRILRTQNRNIVVTDSVAQVECGLVTENKLCHTCLFHFLLKFTGELISLVFVISHLHLLQLVSCDEHVLPETMSDCHLWQIFNPWQFFSRYTELFFYMLNCFISKVEKLHFPLQITSPLSVTTSKRKQACVRTCCIFNMELLTALLTCSYLVHISIWYVN